MSEQAQTIDDRPATRAAQMLGGAAERLKPLIESVEKSAGLLGPDDVADHLQARIDELGLGTALARFREHGYTAIEDVAPPEEMDELREAIHGLSQGVPGTEYRGASFLLGRHPAIDRIVTNPKILAFAEVSVGNGMRASQMAGSIMVKTDEPRPGGIHADQNWLPAPFPEHNCVITFCIPCDGMTAEEGATRVVPGSHLKRRHPTPEEARSESVCIEVEKGGGSGLERIGLARGRPADCRRRAHGAPRHLSTALHPAHRRLQLPAEGRGIHGVRSESHARALGRRVVFRYRQPRRHGRYGQVHGGDGPVQAVAMKRSSPA